ncbi:hypothetical protein [Staphylococcus sp. GDB20D115P1]|jgi:predicted RNase H-like nuclease (RuvC/YqgF family)|uniref:hypothetical protein n=1 Tax=Staphylococcus sp. GDB20D115P1 TaxID=2804085 RepID=UPI001AEBBD85|nr:hypothetical protein [Staphylococcus sp. GDB20D115P1]HJG40259.1 hypothetical protein [Staphylococcus saprophyticus]
MSEYKLDMSKYTIDEQPIMWSDEEYRLAFQSLYFEYHKLKSEHDQYKTERDTLIDDLTWYRAKVDRLEHKNKRLTRLTHKLTTHRTMWDNLKDWRRDMLEIDKNDTQLIGLGLVMDELEKRHLYKGDE